MPNSDGVPRWPPVKLFKLGDRDAAVCPECGSVIVDNKKIDFLQSKKCCISCYLITQVSHRLSLHLSVSKSSIPPREK